MIIPIRQRTGQSEDIPVDKLEWVMLELNGELLQPLDKIHTIQQGAVGPGGASAAASSKKRTVELGSVRVDTDVSPNDEGSTCSLVQHVCRVCRCCVLKFPIYFLFLYFVHTHRVLRH
mmetsp:Transcript_5386/g.10977  ORF Transcript_5386/g.10977 Transcript_5386/m.10977 type:complete len:118 (-) Transcript_5386:1975-2328(-)